MKCSVEHTRQLAQWLHAIVGMQPFVERLSSYVLYLLL